MTPGLSSAKGRRAPPRGQTPGTARFLLGLLGLGVLCGARIEDPFRAAGASAAELHQPASPRGATTGTARMVERLARIAAEADPRQNLYLNDRRARMTERELERVRDRRTRARGLYLLAPELVLSGRTRDGIVALEELEELMSELGGDAKLRSDIDELLGIAYLRLAEQMSRARRRSIEYSLLPIGGEGIYAAPDLVRSAIARFSKVLHARPGDVTVRWLLNIAYMAVGGYPEQVPKPYLVPEEVFSPDADIQRFTDRAGELGLDVDSLAGGVVVEDLDRDGDLDLMCSSRGLRDQLRLFRNNGDGTFTDVTDAAGLKGIVSGLNLVHADYDNDGLPDVLVLRGAWLKEQGLHPNSLLRNTGNLTFRDVTEEAGLLSFHPTQTASWADYDNDGWLDLFIGNESEPEHHHPSELYHNNGDGTFTECGHEQGVAVIGLVKAVVWGDYSNDRWPDLYVSRLGEPNLLFRNDGPAGGTKAARRGRAPPWRFTEVAAEAGVTEPIASFPAWFFDYDNDGWEDLFVSGYGVARGGFGVDYMELEHKGEPPRLYRNQGDGTFSDVTKKVGLDRLVLAMGSNFGDLDNDGFLDFYLGTGEPDLRALVPNKMYRNDQGRRFQDVTTSGGFGLLQKGHGVAFADFDHDGDQDIYEVMGGAYSGDVYMNVLFENPGHGHHWIALSLEGERSNRSAIGARIRVEVDTPRGRRDVYVTVNTGGSFGSTTLRKTVGLGDATSIRRIEITWPASESPQVFEDVPLDVMVEVKEEERQPKVLKSIPSSWGGKRAS